MAELLERGTLVAETWEVEERLGRGGMGEVWRAHHLRVEGKQAAIKVLHAVGTEADAYVARFKREAEIAARLEHPNIVQVFDYATLPSGEPYIVMELLRGESLKDRLKRGPMTLEELRPLVAQLCSALHVAHGRGVVHRDLKPDNLFLVPTPTGPQLKVLDFGISKLLDSHTVQTSEDVLIGTPLYMSPEQASGDNASLTARSDLFTMASICYEALAGSAPFRGDGVVKIIYRILQVDPPDIPGLDAEAMGALRRALVKEPAQRTPDAAAFAAEFCGVSLSALPRPGAAAPASSPPEEHTRESARPKAVTSPGADQPTKELRVRAPPRPGSEQATPAAVPASIEATPRARNATEDAAPEGLSSATSAVAPVTAPRPVVDAAPGTAALPTRPVESLPAHRRPAFAALGAGAALGLVALFFALRSPSPTPEPPVPQPAPLLASPDPSAAPRPDVPVATPAGDAGLGDAQPATATATAEPSPDAGPARHAATASHAAVKEPPLDALSQGFLADAELAFSAERFPDVLALTQRPGLATSGRAAALRVMAACALGNLGLANATRPRVPASQLAAVRRACKARGIELP